jgi:hypothetical protein
MSLSDILCPVEKTSKLVIFLAQKQQRHSVIPKACDGV